MADTYRDYAIGHLEDAADLIGEDADSHVVASHLSASALCLRPEEFGKRAFNSLIVDYGHIFDMALGGDPEGAISDIEIMIRRLAKRRKAGGGRGIRT